MSKFISSVLDDASRMLVNHTGWAYLDCMTKEEQLEVITTYRDQSLTGKYIVVVFEKNERAVKHHKRCEELGLNQEEGLNMQTFAAEIIQSYDQNEEE
tara:strand:- start:1391 stop:1684 length:294 start_codon:yes stop_codon:yes gene_type:complete